MTDPISALEFDRILTKLSGHACTEAAKQRLSELRPSADESRVRTSLRETGDARSLIDRYGSPPLTAMKELRDLLEIAQKGGMLVPEQFSHLLQFLAAIRRMKGYLKKAEESEIGLAFWGGALDPLDLLRGEIDSAIRGVIVDDNASKELRDLRRKIENANARIKSQLDDLLRKRREYFSDGFVSMRDGHYTLPVKKEYKHQVSGSVISVSGTGATYFIEPSSVIRLRDDLAALKTAEHLEEEKILYTLTALVDDCRADLLRNIETMEALDFVFAKGKLSVELRGVEPAINTKRRMKITGGRHPLLDAASCVPLDFAFPDRVRGVVVTGPNTGGKTVSLKTVGLFSLMAQCGLHLPCEQADLCLCGEVLCDIGDGQSITENLSTFSAHITGVIEILRRANRDSLVLLDELGSGTDPAEGMGIAVSILEELRARNCLFVATTHYPEVKEYAQRTEGLVNARMTFDRESLRPLYQLEVGEAGESCALYIAQRLGLPHHMLERAYAEAYRVREVPSAPPAEFLAGIPQASSAPVSVPSGATVKKQKAAAPSHAQKFQVGDTVVVYPKKELGIVYHTANSRGEVGVQIKKVKQLVSHKRLQIKTPAEQLYPEDYDFSILFDSVETRKTRRKMEKGHTGLEIGAPEWEA